MSILRRLTSFFGHGRRRRYGALGIPLMALAGRWFRNRRRRHALSHG